MAASFSTNLIMNVKRKLSKIAREKQAAETNRQ